MGKKVETLNFITMVKSFKELEAVRAILNNEDAVEYWNLNFMDSGYNLTIIGTQLKKVVSRLKNEGYIAEVF